MTAETTRDFIIQMQTERADLHDRIARLDAVLSSLVALYPELVTATGATSPVPMGPVDRKSGAASDQAGIQRSVPAKIVVRELLERRRGDRLTVDQIATEIKDQGWGQEYPDAAAVLRTALRRLADRGESGVQRERTDGRTFHYWMSVETGPSSEDGPTNAESPAATGLSVVTTHEPQEGGDADGTGDHRDHDPREGHRDHSGSAPSVAEG